MVGAKMAKICFGILSLALTASLAGCAGSGSPLPPRTIGEPPQSIVDTLPPDDGGQLPAEQQAGLDGQQPIQTTATVSPQTQTPVATYQAPASSSILTFEPMVGAPKSVARELSKSLGMRVAQQALPVVPRNQTGITHRVKGYFSASESGQNCVVSYVWDIFDANGKRINRITGSQKTTMVSTNPWDAVTAPVLDKVAVDTAAQLKSWHTSL